MTYFHKLHNKLYCLIVNVDELWSLLPQEAKDDALLIDVTQTASSRFWAKDGSSPEKMWLYINEAASKLIKTTVDQFWSNTELKEIHEKKERVDDGNVRECSS
ncbi:hypothetical protein EV2_007449 [Malus domestica]